MRLLVARHGATQHNLDGRFTGQFDAPLSALGKRQAEALAARLAGQRFDAIVSSDLLRARQTAGCIAARCGQEVTLDPDLREVSMGAWEGRSVAEIRREEGALLAEIETDTTGEISYPQGESAAQLRARALLLHALGLSNERRWQFARGNTSLFEFEYLPAMVKILRANDTSHLELLSAAEGGERSQVI